MIQPTQRFSDRVENYIKYRPGYPAALVELLEEGGALAAGATIADIGSGTGLLSQLFLRRGLEVIGVEPNEAMRRAGEHLLVGWQNFTSLCGQAEATGLEAASVDLVVAGQAFHWFEQTAARKEFSRILKAEGWVALIWNDRLVEGPPFAAAYENLLHAYAKDYAQVNHKNIDEKSTLR